jgi:chemotaxis protein histidine kinase CheA
VLRNGLAHFAREYAQHAQSLQSLAATAQWQPLAREAHTLKGLGQQLGLKPVADAARALEATLNAAPPNGPTPQATAGTQQLAAALDAAVEELVAHPPWPQRSAQAPSSSTKDLQVHWDRLRRQLSDSDSEALVLWQRDRRALMDALPAAAARALDEAMQRCDFDAALACVPAAEEALA